MNQFFSFFKKKVGFYGMWHILFTVCGCIAAADSVYVLFYPMQKQFLASFGSEFIAAFIAFLVSAAYLLVVDISLMKFLPSTLTGIFNGTIKSATGETKINLRKLYYGTIAFCLIQTAASVYVSYTLRHSTVELVTEKPALQNINALTEKGDASQQSRIKSADDEIKRITAERDKAVNNVPKKAAKMQPYGVGGSWLDRQNAYKSAVASANSDYQTKVKSVAASFMDRLTKAEESKRSILNDPTLSASITAANNINEFEIESFYVRPASFSDFLLLLSVASTLVMWYAGFMMSHHNAAFNIGSIESLLPKGNVSTAATSVLSTPRSTPSVATASTGTTATPRNPIGFVQYVASAPVTTALQPVITVPPTNPPVNWVRFNDLSAIIQRQQLEKYGGPFTNEAFQYAVRSLNPRFGQAQQGWLMNSDDAKLIEAAAVAYDADKEAQKAVTTTQKPVTTENKPQTEVEWVTKLQTVELDGETFEASDIIKAKTNVIVYWNRSITSAKPETREINRQKAERFKQVLETTGLNVELNPDGTGRVYL